MKNACGKNILIMCQKKKSKSVGIIRKVHKYLNRSGLFTLYYSLVYPYLSYCNIVWACIFPTYLHKLHLIQKRFVRIASSESTATSTRLFSKSNILFIYNINTVETFIFVFKVQYLGHTLPYHFQQYFQNNNNNKGNLSCCIFHSVVQLEHSFPSNIKRCNFMEQVYSPDRQLTLPTHRRRSRG